MRALMAFEAVARTSSFRAAAEEMNVTRSAISHQIRALEEQLGILLFKRDKRPVELTVAGQAYFPAVREAFDQIEEQTRRLNDDEADNELTIQVYVTVALKWLIPRLYDFEQRYPGMQVRLSTSNLDWDFDRGNVDVAFILSRRKIQGLHSRELFHSALVPVCSPELITGANLLRTPEDLRNHALIHVYTAEEDWQAWLDKAGLVDLKPSRKLSFDSYVMALQAAADGKGVAMAMWPFAAEDIDNGKLVCPFDLQVLCNHSWKIIYESAHRHKTKIRHFEKWLIAQVQNDPEVAALS
jgi:LysR family glycine cleavage system transcriptional activator